MIGVFINTFLLLGGKTRQQYFFNRAGKQIVTPSLRYLLHCWKNKQISHPNNCVYLRFSPKVRFSFSWRYIRTHHDKLLWLFMVKGKVNAFWLVFMHNADVLSPLTKKFICNLNCILHFPPFFWIFLHIQPSWQSAHHENSSSFGWSNSIRQLMCVCAPMIQLKWRDFKFISKIWNWVFGIIDWRIVRDYDGSVLVKLKQSLNYLFKFWLYSQQFTTVTAMQHIIYTAQTED